MFDYRVRYYLAFAPEDQAYRDLLYAHLQQCQIKKAPKFQGMIKDLPEGNLDTPHIIVVGVSPSLNACHALVKTLERLHASNWRTKSCNTLIIPLLLRPTKHYPEFLTGVVALPRLLNNTQTADQPRKYMVLNDPVLWDNVAYELFKAEDYPFHTMF